MAPSPVSKRPGVFSNSRKPRNNSKDPVVKDKSILINSKNVTDGLHLLNGVHSGVITAVFFDPQYRGIMDKMQYGNEGERQKKRANLQQMDGETISSFIREIDRVLIPSGHLFLWIDKFHLCEGTSHWFDNTSLSTVDLITWDKGKMGMGYRTRRKSEYLLIVQKLPAKAKGVWTNHKIPDVWSEKITGKKHPHQKPVGLQIQLIGAVSSENDYILDPCAGSYSVLDACLKTSRNFIGCDLQIF